MRVPMSVCDPKESVASGGFRGVYFGLIRNTRCSTIAGYLMVRHFPLVKTLDYRIPLSDTLVDRLHA